VQVDEPAGERPDAIAGRQALVWQQLTEVLAAAAGPVRPAVLDCGGGSGSFAVPLARAGARVTVVDVSADALATLRRRAAEAGVAAYVVPVQGDVEALPDAIGAEQFDLVLAHGVLGAVDHLPTAFSAIVSAMRPGAALSVLVDNPVASVLARALAGEVTAALAELRGLTTTFGQAGPESIQALCRVAGLVVQSVHGIGVFSELVPGAALEAPGALEALALLEAESATRPPFSEIASKVHLLARALVRN
jgi:ubiquinone/menaquinone biosynthesis C-methylase UbiE